ncbi:hypothetical protein [Leptospira inadai]|uniref:Uncharacterized protein n=1 Tax=Leptospira inadai serovar Lyme TaxID=293084 RepID=A0ABX4YCW9_9LEPT|nr:hypothetical protein [Leptospira inadai]PNV71518.1 hypothetical protein BES34_021310 [Leptospira inadai serovar Lyme]
MTKAYLFGTLASSLFTTGVNSENVVFNAVLGAIFVADSGANTVIVLNAIRNSFFYGTLAESSLNTDTNPF